MATLLQDLRYGLRMLAKTPGFTTVAVLTLALGIGANTAIFTLIDAVLLRPLPYPEPNRLVHFVWGPPGNSMDALSPLEDQYWTEHSQVLESYATYQTGYGMNLSASAQPDYVHGAAVSKDFFHVLGVHPTVGRDFLREEDRRGNPRVVILSYNLWSHRFGADPSLPGKQILLDGQPVTVVGILPRSFQFVQQPGKEAIDLWFPLQLRVDPSDQGHNYQVIARLKPDVTLEQAQAQMDALLPSFRQDYPKHLGPREQAQVRLVPYREWIAEYVRTPLLLLFGAVVLVLLIATVNVANLLLARSATRQAEISVRLALGASGFRLFRQFVTESLILAGLGCAAGLMMAPWAKNTLLAITPQDFLPWVGEVKLDLPVLGFAVLVSILTGFLAGIVPVLRVSRLDLNSSLKEGGRAAIVGLGHHRLRSALVVSEVALSLVLLAGATLLIVSLYDLVRVNPGFDPRDLWTFRMSLPPEKYKATAQVWSFKQQVSERLRTLPGVTAVASASNLPLEWGFNFGIDVLGGGQKTPVYIQARAVSPEYFGTLGIPVLRGRPFLDSDTGTSEPVVVISESLARRCCRGRDPLGHQVYFGQLAGNERSGGGRVIVGVVADTKLYLNEPAYPTLYFPMPQVPDDDTTYMDRAFLTAWVVKTTAPLQLSNVQRLVDEVDPTQPVVKLLQMAQVLSESVAPARFMALLTGSFAGLALVLAAIGLYGVISYAVTERTHEIGVRMALGARRSDVLRLVVGQGLRLALAGTTIGLALSFAVTRLLQNLLFGVKPTDPLAYVTISVLLTTVALAASYIPARRATNVDPVVALRYE